MYIINDKLAVHGFDFNPETYELSNENDRNYRDMEYGQLKNGMYNRTGQFFLNTNNSIWTILDCRHLSDSNENDLKSYRVTINTGIKLLKQINMDKRYSDRFKGIVCCCSAGQSRSNAIAIGILIEEFLLDFWKAWDLIREKNPICNIAQHHIDALKKIYNITLP